MDAGTIWFEPTVPINWAGEILPVTFDAVVAVAALPVMLMVAVPAFRLEGLKPVRPAPLPKNVPPKLPNRFPLKVTDVALLVTKTLGNSGSGIVPVMSVAATEPAFPA